MRILHCPVLLAMSADRADAASTEWDATTYHRIATPQFTWGQKVLERLALRGDETAIDAGCGSGRLTALLLERLPHGRVIAVDRSENMLQAARAYLEPRFGERVSFLRSDLEALLLDAVADLIFSTATLHWIPDHPTLFRSLYRALKPGGRLVAQCGGGPNLAHLLSHAATLMATAPYDQFFADWSGPWEFADAATTAERLRTAGFIDVETSLEPAPTLLPGADDYRAFLTTAIFRLHLERLPDEQLRATFLDTLTTQAAHDDPPFSLDYWRLNLRGTRPPV
jgi:trans-aconitate methyltransferase